MYCYGQCYLFVFLFAGNIVSDGRLVRDSEGIQNAHFGITKEGFLFTG